MASSKDRRKGGRVTPKGGVPTRSATGPRKSMRPARIGPFQRPERGAPLGQVGRRPSSPVKLFVFAVMYLACGVAAFFVLPGSLGVVIGIVFIGLSLLWLRGASTALLRQQRGRP